MGGWVPAMIGAGVSQALGFAARLVEPDKRTEAEITEDDKKFDLHIQAWMAHRYSRLSAAEKKQVESLKNVELGPDGKEVISKDKMDILVNTMLPQTLAQAAALDEYANKKSNRLTMLQWGLMVSAFTIPASSLIPVGATAACLVTMGAGVFGSAAAMIASNQLESGQRTILGAIGDISRVSACGPESITNMPSDIHEMMDRQEQVKQASNNVAMLPGALGGTMNNWKVQPAAEVKSNKNKLAPT